MRVFYNPPETYYNEEREEDVPFPPFEFEISAEPYLFESPHAYFKKVDETYEVGMYVNSRGEPIKNIKGSVKTEKRKRKVWAIDEKKTQDFKNGYLPPPQNYLDLKPAQLEELARGKYSFFAKHLRKEDSIIGEHRNAFAEIQRKHYDEMAKLKKDIEAEGQRARQLLEDARRQREVLEKKLKKDKPSLPVVDSVDG